MFVNSHSGRRQDAITSSFESLQRMPCRRSVPSHFEICEERLWQGKCLLESKTGGRSGLVAIFTFSVSTVELDSDAIVSEMREGPQGVKFYNGWTASEIVDPKPIPSLAHDVAKQVLTDHRSSIN